MGRGDNVKTSVEEKFWARVRLGARPDDCWLWTGSTNDSGYGQIRITRKNLNTNLRAHRIALDLAGIPVPSGHEAHHVYGVRTCVNPDHLEFLTKSQHSRMHRGTHCKNGHEKNDENVYVTPAGVRSHCRVCARESSRAYYVRQKEVMGS